MVGALREAGLARGSADDATVIIVNTCAVTAEAEAKARKAIRHAARRAGHPLVVVTGCMAALNADEIERLGENVVVEPQKDQVARRALDELALRGMEPSEAAAETAVGETATGRTRPGIKIQDGCDLRCAYCIVWKARGPSRSTPVEEVVRRLGELCEQGAREVMLTGINLGTYRARRPEGEATLADLLEELLGRTSIARIRLGSIEPQDVDERLVSVMAASGGRVAPFLHMCLQSGCDATLARMGRVYDTGLFADRVALAREAIPRLALGTDLIVGFPGESEREFSESLSFCEEMAFSRMHVFRFSPRPGTPAAGMGGRPSPIVAASRAQRARDLSSRLRHEEASRLVGSKELVVVQGARCGVSGGLFDVRFASDVPMGGLVEARVDDVSADATLLATPIACL